MAQLVGQGEPAPIPCSGGLDQNRVAQADGPPGVEVAPAVGDVPEVMARPWALMSWTIGTVVHLRQLP